MTDLPWLVELINVISSTEVKDELPVWSTSSLRDKLKESNVEDLEANNLINYLSDLGLLALSNIPESNTILSINQINSDITENTLVSEEK